MRTTKTSQKLVVFPEAAAENVSSRVTDLESDFGGDNAEISADSRRVENLVSVFSGDQAAADLATSRVASHHLPTNVPAKHLVQYPYAVAKEKEAERSRRTDKHTLPRVTAYCTAKAYKMESLMTYLRGMHDSNATDPKRFDECIYTCYSPPVTIFQVAPIPSSHSRHGSASTIASMQKPRMPQVNMTPNNVAVAQPIHRQRSVSHESEDLFKTPPTAESLAVHFADKLNASPSSSKSSQGNEGRTHSRNNSYNAKEPVKNATVVPHNSGELFFFDYGVVVMWGLTEPQEYFVLSLMTRFEDEKLDPDDVEMEELNFQYRAFSQVFF